MSRAYRKSRRTLPRVGGYCSDSEGQVVTPGQVRLRRWDVGSESDSSACFGLYRCLSDDESLHTARGVREGCDRCRCKDNANCVHSSVKKRARRSRDTERELQMAMQKTVECVDSLKHQRYRERGEKKGQSYHEKCVDCLREQRYKLKEGQSVLSHHYQGYMDKVGQERLSQQEEYLDSVKGQEHSQKGSQRQLSYHTEFTESLRKQGCMGLAGKRVLSHQGQHNKLESVKTGVTLGDNWTETHTGTHFAERVDNNIQGPSQEKLLTIIYTDSSGGHYSYENHSHMKKPNSASVDRKALNQCKGEVVASRQGCNGYIQERSVPPYDSTQRKTRPWSTGHLQEGQLQSGHAGLARPRVYSDGHHPRKDTAAKQFVDARMSDYSAQGKMLIKDNIDKKYPSFSNKEQYCFPSSQDLPGTFPKAVVGIPVEHTVCQNPKTQAAVVLDEKTSPLCDNETGSQTERVKSPHLSISYSRANSSSNKESPGPTDPGYNSLSSVSSAEHDHVTCDGEHTATENHVTKDNYVTMNNHVTKESPVTREDYITMDSHVTKDYHVTQGDHVTKEGHVTRDQGLGESFGRVFDMRMYGNPLFSELDVETLECINLRLQMYLATVRWDVRVLEG